MIILHNSSLPFLTSNIIISWAVLITLLVIFKKNFKFGTLDILSFVAIFFGIIYQFTSLFEYNDDILKSVASYFYDPVAEDIKKESYGSEYIIQTIDLIALNLDKFLKGIYFFLIVNVILTFFGGFIIRKQSEKSKLKNEKYYINYKGTDKIASIISVALALIISLFFIGIDVKSLSIITGIIVGGVTYSLRDLIGNFIAGLILLWDDSIMQNNVISIQNYLTSYDEEPYGWIDEINMRFTVVKDRNNINLVIPNLVLINNPIINWTQYDNSVRIRLDIDISYNSDLEKAIKVIPLACVNEDRVLKSPKYQPKVNVMRFSDSAIGLQLRFYINDPKNGIRNIKSQIFRNVVKILKLHNIEIPYPQRDVHLDIRNSTKVNSNEKDPVLFKEISS